MNLKAVLRSVAAVLLLGGVFFCFSSSSGKKERVNAEKTTGPRIADIPTDKSADELLAELKMTDYVVTEDSVCTNGREKLDEFMDSYKKGEPALLKYAQYYTLDPEHCAEEYYEQEKDNYPQLFVGELEFDGKDLYMTIRKSDEAEPDPREDHAKFGCFKHETDGKFEYYYLVDSEDVTYAELRHQMLSSTLLEHYDRWHFVAFFKTEG